MKVDAAGWVRGVRKLASPNCDRRPPGLAAELLVMHNISLPPGEFGGDAIERFFTNCLHADAHPYFVQIARLRVSAHFLIRRNGEIIQFVSCDRRAWHAGESSWRGRTRCNDFSIGIELEGTDAVPFDDAQYRSLSRLLRVLRRRYLLRDAAGHSDIAPGRKTDPGPCFDWDLLAAWIRLAR